MHRPSFEADAEMGSGRTLRALSNFYMSHFPNHFFLPVHLTMSINVPLIIFAGWIDTVLVKYCQDFMIDE